MIHLLNPTQIAIAENNARAKKRMEICKACPDVSVVEIMGHQQYICQWCNCVMAVKTQLPQARCAHPTEPKW